MRSRLIFRIALSIISMALSLPGLADTADIVAFAKPALVFIKHKVQSGSEVTGSGFLVKANGVVVTCAHVVGPKPVPSSTTVDKVTVRMYDGTNTEATVLYSDAESDIAVLEVPVKDYPYLDLQKIAPRVGEEVVVIGYPLGEALGKDISATRGIVSAIRMGGAAYQLDAPVNPGNSGGPVLNKDGEAIGVVSFRIRGSEGLAFAVAASEVPLKATDFGSLVSKFPNATDAAKGAVKILREDQNSKTPLHRAVYADDLAQVKKLIAGGCDLNAKQAHGETPLHRAALLGFSDVLHQLLESGANANAQDNDGDTPLHEALYMVEIECIKQLLEHGAKVNERNKLGQTPLAVLLEKSEAWPSRAEGIGLLRENGGTR